MRKCTKRGKDKYNVGENHPNFKHGFSLEKHYCKCGKEIHWSTALKGGGCQSCGSKRRLANPQNHPMYGKKHSKETILKMKNKTVSEETKRKISENHADISGIKNPFYGKKHSEESKKKLSLSHKGQIAWNKGKRDIYSEETKRKMSEAKKGKKIGPFSEKARQNISKSKKGTKNPMYGIKGKNAPAYGKRNLKLYMIEYNGVMMRSGWEKLYAEYLDKNNIKWQYEPTTFDLGNSTYTPDFYLDYENKYIEIKGYLTDYAKNKMRRFKRKYPDINFEILKFKQLRKLKIL